MTSAIARRNSSGLEYTNRFMRSFNVSWKRSSIPIHLRIVRRTMNVRQCQHPQIILEGVRKKTGPVAPRERSRFT